MYFDELSDERQIIIMKESDILKKGTIAALEKLI